MQYNHPVLVLDIVYMIHDMYEFHRYFYQDKMVYQYVFHNDDYQEEEHNRFYKMYMLIHLMKYNLDMIHDMEDTGISFLIDKIQVNMTIHMCDIVDMDICLFSHMIYIDLIVDHYMLNISNHTIDTYREKNNVEVQI
jgi:hypothetical protein